MTHIVFTSYNIRKYLIFVLQCKPVLVFVSLEIPVRFPQNYPQEWLIKNFFASLISAPIIRDQKSYFCRVDAPIIGLYYHIIMTVIRVCIVCEWYNCIVGNWWNVVIELNGILLQFKKKSFSRKQLEDLDVLSL